MCNHPTPVAEPLIYFPGIEPGAVPDGRVAFYLAGHGELMELLLIFHGLKAQRYTAPVFETASFS